MRMYKNIQQGTLQPIGIVGVINESLLSKEVNVSLKDKSSVNGIVREVNGGYIVLSRFGDWSNKVKLFIDNIEDLDSSEYPYYSLEHKRNLRVQKIPRSEFRYNEEELKELLNKFAFVNYDGKLIDGKITDVKYTEDGSNSIVIKNDNEYKTIYDYRLREVEVTGDNPKSHQFAKKLRQLETDLYMDLERDYSCGNIDELRDKRIDPNELIEDYIEYKIKELKGEEVSYDKFNYLWTQEVFDNYEYLIGKDKGTKSELSKDLKRARDVDLYYTRRIEFVDYILKTVKLTDWTKYSKSQTEGEVLALEYLYSLELPIQ